MVKGKALWPQVKVLQGRANVTWHGTVGTSVDRLFLNILFVANLERFPFCKFVLLCVFLLFVGICCYVYATRVFFTDSGNFCRGRNNS